MVIGILLDVPGFRPVALITGGAKRVGAAIAHKLAGNGFDVAITYRQSANDAETLCHDLQQLHTKAIAIKADLSEPEAAVETVRSTLHGTFSRLDLLVNNASRFQKSILANMTLAQLRKDQAVHVESPLLLIKAFADDLRRAQGTIVNMIDVLAEKPFPSYMAYCASKAALANLTLSLARELAPEVTVNGIAPGVVDWPEDYTLDMREKYLQRVPLKRAGTPEDVANLVHFLATGGKYITGQIIRLDGGRSLT